MFWLENQTYIVTCFSLLLYIIQVENQMEAYDKQTIKYVTVCVYWTDKQNKNDKFMLRHLSNNFLNQLQKEKKHFLSNWPQYVLFQNTTWRSAYHCFCRKRTISHMLCIYLRSPFKSEKGVNRFRNMSREKRWKRKLASLRAKVSLW